MTEPRQFYHEVWKPYTINLTTDMKESLQAKAERAGIRRLSIFIRAILEREINSESILTMDDIISARRESLKLASAQIRREEEIKRPSWISLKIRKVRNLFNPRQQIFEFEKK